MTLCILSFSVMNNWLANVYEFTTAEDFLVLYHVDIQRISIDQEKTPTFISGKMDSHSKLHDLISRYIRNLHFTAKHLRRSWKY
jgi:preprotein translocase subunit SecA